MRNPTLLRPVALLLLLSLMLVAGNTPVYSQDNRYFPQTGYRVEHELIWDYFVARGGADTFGYPVSNTFQFRGLPVQIFQRHMIQVVGNQARPVNLLDPDFMPLTRYNGSTFPAYDGAIAMAAPPPQAANYGQAVEEHVAAVVPNNWNGIAVGLRDYYYSAAPASASGPRALVALEVWGFPTSAPRRDPTNSNFIYQRFQRGIIHHDASSGVTRGILLGDAFKQMLTGENLPTDLANELSGSPFLHLYDPDQAAGLARSVPGIDPPITHNNTDLSGAFVSGEGGGTGEPVTRVGLQEIVSGLTAPVFLIEPPDNSGRLFVVDQIGLIRIIEANGTLRPEPFLDLRDRMVSLRTSYDERGLLGLAFHTEYATNGRFFVYYSAPLRSGAPSGWDHTSHLAEYRVSSDPMRASVTSERILMHIDQPQANHNGGMIGFGPDGYLYVALGDGGNANDTGTGHVAGGNAQDRINLLGALLRLDVDGAQPYGIPEDNPFVGEDGADEIYAFGFRNPYRFSWDRGSGALYVADAGQNLYEEVSLVLKGGNYGWNLREGNHCFNPSNPNVPPASCATSGARGEPLLGPVIEYPHTSESGIAGLVTVGGYLYRGSAIPALRGQFVLADWSRTFNQPTGQLFAAAPREDALWPLRRLNIAGSASGLPGIFILSLAEDNDGELYLLGSRSAGPTGSTGVVFRIVPAP